MRIPGPPKGAGPQGRALWRSVLAEFELNAAELAVLRQAVRAADRCEALAAEVAEHGLTALAAHGAVKLNPVVAELRAAELAVARLLVCLRIPVGGVQDESPPAQHRGIRGVYQIGGAA